MFMRRNMLILENPADQGRFPPRNVITVARTIRSGTRDRLIIGGTQAAVPRASEVVYP